MTNGLLTTKLIPPPLRLRRVARPRLTALLDQGATRALTLISATAGFGKTTLVNEWSAAGTRRICWLTLDADDNTPTRLLRHIIGALQTIAPEWGNEISARLDANPLAPLDDAADLLLNELNTLSEPCTIILDDYHVITAPPVHQALGHALEHLPPRVHLILLTRADPPLPLARVRARDQLTEIRASDLAFRPDETAQFLMQVMGLELTPAQVLALEKRTEGWIAGLQLAALSLRGQSDVNAFIENFTGNDHYIFDYLAEEVIRKLDAPTRSFLLQTSILDRVCMSLGQAVTEIADAQTVLERLEHDNLFTIALDTRREWYRYHHLFAQVLQHELRQTRPGEISELHRRAAQWFETRGLVEKAIEHWLAAGEFQRAAVWIEQNVIGCLERAEFKTMLGWLDALPQEFHAQYPRLALAQVWAFMVLGQFDQAEAHLTHTARHLTDPADLVQLDALRALFVTLRGGADRIQHARRAYDASASGSDFTRGFSALNLGTCYLSEGELDAASSVLSQAANLLQRAGNHILVTIAASAYADTEMLRGRLHRAQAGLEKILKQQPVPNTTSPPPIYSMWVALADLDREWNHLDRAVEKLERAIAIVPREFGAARLFLVYSAVLRAQTRYDAAQDMLDRARTSYARFPLTMFQTQLTAEQGALYLALGNVAEAAVWFETRGVNGATPVSFANEAQLLVFVELLMAQARWDEASELLTRLHQATEKGGRIPRLIWTEALQARVAAARGDEQQSHTLLQVALERAAPEGYIRTFVERGADVAKALVTMHMRESSLESYRKNILAAFPSVDTSATLSAGTNIDALSERELEILHLVATGLSNNQIAQELVLTAGTVKWHVNNIFGKLDVHNRTQAVARAREIKLLV